QGRSPALRRAARVRHEARHRLVRPSEDGALREVAVSRSRFGECFAGEGSDSAHVNTVLGAAGGPVETAWATALATPSSGHAPFVCVMRPGLPVRPLTLFVNKAEI